MTKSKYKIRIICGFRPDQEYSIDANEAHKAYYLFNNPDKRGVFDDGLAIKGSDIQRIVPDYQTTMGWNPTHKLTDEDMNLLYSTGVIQKLREIMSLAKEVSETATHQHLLTPLIEFKRERIEMAKKAKDLAISALK